MASELVVALVSIAFVAVPLALLLWALGRTARHTAEAGSSVFGALGTLLAVVGLIALLWTQLHFDDRLVHDPGASRWDVATGPLVVIALGLLVCIGAQILRAVQERERHEVR
jgi:NADH:ubiquinone oxidoreductase subunit 2 (subunit N)